MWSTILNISAILMEFSSELLICYTVLYTTVKLVSHAYPKVMPTGKHKKVLCVDH